jgi:protein-disulfide isomerase
MISLLNQRSDPPGYSLRAANAALAVADLAPNRFLDFHDSLYGDQPQEGGRGYENSQLVDLGHRLGVTGTRFADEINGGTFTIQIQHSLSAATDPALQHPDSNGGSGFDTPTVAVNGKPVDTTDPAWLDKLTASAATG